MKIEMKKIVLVMIVGILSFCWAFGVEENVEMGDFQEIKIINNTKDYTLSFALNEDKQGGKRLQNLKPSSVGKSIKLEGDAIKKIHFLFLREMKDQPNERIDTGVIAVKLINPSRQYALKELKNLIDTRLAKMPRAKSLSVTVKEEGVNTLVIAIEQKEKAS